eukprot:5344998-Pyramimonas_sp.AAC.2
MDYASAASSVDFSSHASDTTSRHPFSQNALRVHSLEQELEHERVRAAAPFPLSSPSLPPDIPDCHTVLVVPAVPSIHATCLSVPRVRPAWLTHAATTSAAFSPRRARGPRFDPLRSALLIIQEGPLMTLFYGSSCANNGNDALNTPDC